jgi:predicted amidohydrolase
MILAAAQINSVQGNIEKNLEKHYRMIELAHDSGAGLITFPEMSITGYTRDLAVDYEFTENDTRLDKLRSLAFEKNIYIIAGAPVRIKTELYIGSFILKPDQSLDIYTKQFLHEGEQDFFNSSFNYNPILDIDGERISLAICADIDAPLHAQNAAKANTTIYIPSIFFSTRSISKGHQQLSGYAKEHQMNILMSNYYGQQWEMEAGGCSAFWNKDGKLIAELSSKNSGLLLIEKKANQWIGKTFPQN